LRISRGLIVSNLPLCIRIEVLGQALNKIPQVSPAPSSAKLYADPYSGTLYRNDDYSGRIEVGYGPYDAVTTPMVLGARISGNPIMAEAGFDGTYSAPGPGTTVGIFQTPVLGGWS